MATMPLAVKYRPKDFTDLTEQQSIVNILTNQVDTDTVQHSYLFVGPAGTGKTTSARIFANMINDGVGKPIEIDAASNSGVDDIRTIIEDSKKKSLESKYKIFIIDEAHSLSNSAWQALLKLLEESPKYSIFIMCTTNPEKIPNTIMSRVQQFKFNRISNDGIKARLITICDKEKEIDSNISYTEDSLEYLTKLADGGMRSAITMLDKCLSLSKKLDIDVVLNSIDVSDYDTFFKLTDLLVNKNKECINIISELYQSGKDLNQFIVDYMKFLLDVMSFIIFGNTDNTRFPKTDETLTQLETYKSKEQLLMTILKFVKKLNEDSKYRTDLESLISITFLIYCDE